MLLLELGAEMRDALDTKAHVVINFVTAIN